MPALLAAIPAFIAALPYLFKALSQMMSLTSRLVTWAQDNNLHQWINDLEGKIDALEKSKTPAEKLAAARDLSNVLKSFG